MRCTLLVALLTIVTSMDPNAHNINRIGGVWNCSQSHFEHDLHKQDLLDFLNSHKPIKIDFTRPELNFNTPGQPPVIQRPTITPQWG